MEVESSKRLMAGGGAIAQSPEVNVAKTDMLALKPSRVQKESSRWTASTLIALLALAAIILHLVLRFVSHAPRIAWQAPLVLALLAGGLSLVGGTPAQPARQDGGPAELTDHSCDW